MIVNPMLYSGKKLPELDNPGTAADLLAGKQLVDQYGNPLTGAMPRVEQAVPAVTIDANGLITATATQEAGCVTAGTKTAAKQLTKRGSGDLTASGASIIVPAGYYPSQVSKSVATATHPKPTLSRSGGTVTATHVQSAGYTSGGTTTETLTIPTQAGKTVTPTTYAQTAVASGRLTTGAVNVAGDANLVAGNIKAGVSIFGVAGTVPPLNMISGTASVTKDSTETLTINTDFEPNCLFIILMCNAVKVDMESGSKVFAIFATKGKTVKLLTSSLMYLISTTETNLVQFYTRSIKVIPENTNNKYKWADSQVTYFIS